MRKTIRTLISASAALALLMSSVSAIANTQFAGNWKLIPDISSAVDPWRTITLDIDVQGDVVSIDERVDAGRRHITENYRIDTSKEVNHVPIEMWTGNRHIGAFIGGDGTMAISAEWVDDGKTLKLISNYTLEVSQGDTPVRSYTEYRISREGDRLTRLELRSSRNRPIVHVFAREQ